MASYGALRIEAINMCSYETWIIQMKCLFIKYITRIYVSVSKLKLELKKNYNKLKDDFDKWTEKH